MGRCREAEVQAEAAERNAQKLQKEVDLLEVRVVTFQLVEPEKTARGGSNIQLSLGLYRWTQPGIVFE